MARAVGSRRAGGYPRGFEAVKPASEGGAGKFGALRVAVALANASGPAKGQASNIVQVRELSSPGAPGTVRQSHLSENLIVREDAAAV
jgi:hypothetical protein